MPRYSACYLNIKDGLPANERSRASFEKERKSKMAINGGERKRARGFLKGALMLIPNFLRLLYRLFKDPRVPLAEKTLLIGTIVYVVSPLDFLPDVIPFLGQVDDLYLISLVVLRLLSRTSDEVLREHWNGTGDLVAIVDRIVRSAQLVLPKRVQRILLGRVEVAPQIKGGLISSPAVPESIERVRDFKRGE
jgi:uncharacterized membrane protein YkvA (DUF1232 family)